MSYKVLHWKNSRAKLPLVGLCTTYLMLDHFNAPGWLWGVVGTVAVIVLIVDVYLGLTQKNLPYREE